MPRHKRRRYRLECVHFYRSGVEVQDVPPTAEALECSQCSKSHDCELDPCPMSDSTPIGIQQQVIVESRYDTMSIIIHFLHQVQTKKGA
jgi:hypothetical protein